MKILVWHVHGGWLDAFVRGEHDYLLPVTAEGGGRGARPWPHARDVTPEQLRDEDVDVVVLQEPAQLELAERWLGRRIGREVPAVFLEHNAPRQTPATTRHPFADRDDLTIVHVTHFNRLMWDTGSTRTAVIEHGIVDPGQLYTGERESMGVVINEPLRRWRITGSDLLPLFGEAGPIDLFGISGDALVDALGPTPHPVVFRGDLPTPQLHRELARSRVYLHPVRWTSLGLSLLEAMHLGMPVVAFASTEVPRAVPPGAGVVSADLDELVEGARRLLADPDEARARGRIAREVALERYGLERFLRDWDAVLGEITEAAGVRGASVGSSR